jgi:hypothetical protein
MTQQTGIAIAMRYFGKKDGQGLAQFRDEWQELDEASQAQLADGVRDETLTY